MTHQEERQRNRDAIVRAATERFLADGIDKSTVSEIAELAGLTPMSVYRYYGAKKNLATAVANHLLELYLAEHRARCVQTRPPTPETGFEEFARTLRLYLEVYEAHPEYIRFLQDISFYAARENISADIAYLRFATPEPGRLARPARASLLRGQKDGSVRLDFDFELVCMNMTDLLTGGVNFHTCVDEKTQFDILRINAEMIIYYVKSR